MEPSASMSHWHPCAGCRRPVDAHLGLRLKNASWLCSPCARDVVKDLSSQAERPVAFGVMRPAYD